MPFPQPRPHTYRPEHTSTRARAHAHWHARTLQHKHKQPRTHAPASVHACAHACAHARAHTHTHTCPHAVRTHALALELALAHTHTYTRARTHIEHARIRTHTHPHRHTRTLASTLARTQRTSAHLSHSLSAVQRLPSRTHTRTLTRADGQLARAYGLAHGQPSVAAPAGVQPIAGPPVCKSWRHWRVRVCTRVNVGVRLCAGRRRLVGAHAYAPP